MRLAALTVLLLGLGAHASAQVAPEPAPAEALPSETELAELLADPSTTASDAYQIGVRLFEAQRYEVAETAWLRAYSLGQDPTLLVAVADTRQRRDDEPGAVAMLEQYLVERPDAPDRVSVEARIAMLLQSPAILVVRSEQSGHAILLDGVPVEQKTPADLEVKPGTHTVVVVGQGKHVGEKTVQVAYGEVAQLDFTPGTTSDVIVEESAEAAAQAQLAIEKEDTMIRRAVISTGSIAAAAVVTGTVLGFMALQEEQKLGDNPDGKTTDRGELFTIFSRVAFGLAALSAVTSFTLFMTHKNKRKRERETADVRIETRGPGATVTLKF
jgi:hypothetical protein